MRPPPEARLNGSRLTAYALNLEPGYYSDGGGLYMQVGPSGSKSWIFRFMRHTVSSNGKPMSRDMGLGSLLGISLAEAREKAADCRRLLANRIDPIDAPEIASAHARRWKRRSRWRSPNARQPECTNYPREVCEMALAHAVSDQVEAAYRHGDLVEKRRRLMAEWAKYCDNTKALGEVVALKRKGAQSPVSR